jgi:hypothetical protein
LRPPAFFSARAPADDDFRNVAENPHRLIRPSVDVIQSAAGNKPPEAASLKFDKTGRTHIMSRTSKNTVYAVPGADG